MPKNPETTTIEVPKSNFAVLANDISAEDAKGNGTDYSVSGAMEGDKFVVKGTYSGTLRSLKVRDDAGNHIGWKHAATVTKLPVHLTYSLGDLAKTLCQQAVTKIDALSVMSLSALDDKVLAAAAKPKLDPLYGVIAAALMRKGKAQEILGKDKVTSVDVSRAHAAGNTKIVAVFDQLSGQDLF